MAKRKFIPECGDCQRDRKISAAAIEITDGFVSPAPEWKRHRRNTIRKISRIIKRHLGVVEDEASD